MLRMKMKIYPWVSVFVLLTACVPSKPASSESSSSSGDEPPASVPARDDQASPASIEDAAPTEATPVSRAVAESDRSEEDRALDEQRKPIELFEFFGVKPKMRVAELAAGMGYSSELLARIVGPEGRVYGQNTPFILNRFAEGPWSERLKKPVMVNVTRVDSELESPLPADAHDLDAVFLILFYHDTVWFETDREKMNLAIFQALKPGGVYGIVDHSARVGDGVKEAKTLHRIEQTVLVEEVLAAGFVLDAEAEFLRNPSDTRDWNAAPSAAAERRGTSDRFVLRFKKPEERQSTVTCSEPRKKACTREHRPVCGQVDTGVRCVTAPCPSTESKTYSNACTACADEKVVSYVSGACTTP